jgi:N-acetylmuramoyl-L-alanine amidase
MNKECGVKEVNAQCLMKHEMRRNSYPFLFSLLLVLFFVTTFSHSLGAEERAQVRDIRYWSSDGYTRVIVDLSRPVDFAQRRLSSPDRIYFDLRNTRIPKEIQNSLSVGDGILRSVRAGQYDQATVRIVLDLETMDDFSAYILDDPTKLVIDVNAKKPEKPLRPDRHEKITIAGKVLVLDPGHGGHDPGAVGKRGLQEKDVVLDIALKVREILLKEGNIEVVLTRDKDVFIPLPERSLVALQHKADLFVSIHANASPNRGARGIETYLQNWTNEEEANRVAARENYISEKRMKELMAQYKNDDVGKILTDLNRDYKRDESIAIAHYVQNSLYSNVAKVHAKTVDLGVKQAMFFVLMGASMPPSILAEVSFISNPVEEKLLANNSYRRLIAESIAAGVLIYFESSGPAQKMAKAKHNVPSLVKKISSSNKHSGKSKDFLAGR